jgi:molybdopterin molybdotransferase
MASSTQRLHFEEAIAAILAESRAGERVAEVPIVAAGGLVLAEEIVSDIDMPAFDRAAMDGFAFRHADADEATLRDGFHIAGVVAAGPPAAGALHLGPGDCVKIMTGAPVPPGADTVIPVEETSGYAEVGQRVRFLAVPTWGSHIASRGMNLKSGAVVLREGRMLQPTEIAMLASVGRATVRVHRGPRVGFSATGEELREPGEPLPPGCIRNSNAYNLWSQILNARAEPHYLGILRDRPDELREKIAAALEDDFLILSGGISMGEYDFVPAILAELGVELRFQKLFVRPGQPTVFGVRDRGDGHRTLVFGLPGNPISTLFAFDQYVAPAIRVFRHHPQPLATLYRGVLVETVRKREGFLTLVPCISEWRDDRFLLSPMRPQGSADIYAARGIDAVGLIPAPGTEAPAGTIIGFRKLHEP